MNAIRLESGDHMGRSLSVPSVVSCCGRSTVHGDDVNLFRLGVLREIVDGLDGESRPVLPSGESCGLLNPCNLQQGLHVEGLLLGREAQGEQQKDAPGARKRHMTRLMPRPGTRRIL